MTKKFYKVMARTGETTVPMFFIMATNAYKKKDNHIKPLEQEQEKKMELIIRNDETKDILVFDKEGNQCFEMGKRERGMAIIFESGTIVPFGDASHEDRV